MSQPSGGIPAGLVATFSLVWTGAPLQTGAALGLEPDAGAQAWFDACHRAALDHAFDPSFPLHPAAAPRSTYRKGEARYLGHRFYEPAPEIGQCRLDVMTLLLDDEDGVPTRLLQLHLKPLAAAWHCSDALIGAFAAYTRRFTGGGSGIPASDDPALRVWQAALDHRRIGPRRDRKGAREHAPGHGTFVLLSLYDIAPDRFEARDQFAYDIHRLLEADAGGTALQAMGEAAQVQRFSPSPYFEAWLRPGAMVVLSRAYPGSYREDVDRFQAAALNQPPTSRPTKSASAMPGAAAPDLLPEYPPLRHLAPMVAVHALAREEVLRDSHERLIALQDEAARNVFLQLFTLARRSRELARLARRLARLDTAAPLKAPAAQALSDALARSPLREQVTRSLDSLAAAGTTAASTALALAAGVLALALLAAAATLTGRALTLF